MLERDKQQCNNKGELKGCLISHAVDWKDEDSLGYVPGYFAGLLLYLTETLIFYLPALSLPL
jgi:hypothetical protein